SYDSNHRESVNSNVGVLQASAAAPPPGALYAESFDSYSPGADPAGWVDSGPGVPGAGDASLFGASLGPGGGEAFGVASTSSGLNSTLVVSGSAGWASYEYSGRVESDSTLGQTGVTVLSAYPDAAFGYRLMRVGAAPFRLDKLGNGSLACVGST